MAKLLLNLLAVGLIGHVNEVHQNDAAQVAQPQLPSNGLGRLQVGLKDRLRKAAPAHITARVHIDGGHRLSLVDDQIATAL